MEEKVLQMKAFFEERIAECSQRKQALLADGREDEATFEKIKENIYDVFRTVLAAGVNTCGEDEAKLSSFFAVRLQQIPTNWVTAQEKARAHQEEEKAYLEQIKLDAVADIRENFARIWGDER